MNELQPSHILIRVSQLAEAVALYEAAGFTVVWGGAREHAHNALIHFEEGPFLELFDPIPVGEDPEAVRAAMPPRVQRWIDDEGVCEHALEGTTSIEEIVGGMAERGVGVEGPVIPAERTGLDGVTLRWSLAMPDRLDLPFVMSPYEPAPAIAPDDQRHRNRIRRVSGLRIESPRPVELGEALAAMLGGDARATGEVPVVVAADGFSYELTDGPEYRLVDVRLDDGRALADVVAS